MIDCGFSNSPYLLSDRWKTKAPPTPYTRMPQKIKLALLTHDTDLTQLAQSLGCSVPFLSMLLAGKRTSRRLLVEVARRLGLSVSALQQEIQSIGGHTYAHNTTLAHAPKRPRPTPAQRPVPAPAVRPAAARPLAP